MTKNELAKLIAQESQGDSMLQSHLWDWAKQLPLGSWEKLEPANVVGKAKLIQGGSLGTHLGLHTTKGGVAVPSSKGRILTEPAYGSSKRMTRTQRLTTSNSWWERWESHQRWDEVPVPKGTGKIRKKRRVRSKGAKLVRMGFSRRLQKLLRSSNYTNPPKEGCQ